ncbi:ABC transporter ATP-binding protein [Rhizobium rhizogenes]|uniref:ABC transporter ATP-binding protein n=1 Tax=Rhizobium rhizogenes TaxID=359 RepID=UPI001F36DA3A|nr:ABC transporter ATP-binding protein [Rhizobium rhizogenes]
MIKISNLRVDATATGLPIVKNVHFEIAPGEVLGLVGESGSGKTTISLALLGFAKPGTAIGAESRIVLDDTDLMALSPRARNQVRGKLVTYVPQDPSASLNPAMKIGEQLIEGLVRGRSALSPDEAQARVHDLMVEVGLAATPELFGRYPSQLSGGQLQRVAIAMAVAPQPRLVIMDEPTTGLDVSTQADVLSMMTRLCRTHGIATVYVSHDLPVVAHIADKVVVLYAGRVVEAGSRDDVFSRPAHPYTRSLLDAVPSVREARKLRAIAGKAPALADREHGCVFRPRCPHATAICAVAPPLENIPAATHAVACHRTSELDGLARPAPVLVTERRLEEIKVLEVRSLSARYGDRTVLRDVSMTLAKGQCLAVVGESGSGKTTFSRCLIGLHGGWNGEVLLEGRKLAPGAGYRSHDDRRRLQYVFQNPYGSLNPRQTIGGNLAVPIGHFRSSQGTDRNRQIRDVLERVELRSAYIDRFPNELSGGEKQRVAIARALLASPDVMICDEITSALDVSVQAAIVELLRSLMSDGLSLVFVTHNLGVVRSLADTVAVLDKGEIVEIGSCQEVVSRPAAAYTKGLLANTLELA